MSVLDVVCVLVLLAHFTPVKSLTPSAAVSSYRALSLSFYYVRGYSRVGRGAGVGYRRVSEGSGSPRTHHPSTPPHPTRSARSGDETHRQAQVIGRNTFGALKSHRHPVVIHQRMCRNASPPPLNLVRVSGSR